MGDKQRRPRIMPQSRPKRQIKHGGGNSQKHLQGEECEQKLSGAAISVFPDFRGKNGNDEKSNQGESAVCEVNGRQLILGECVQLRIFAGGGESVQGEVWRDEGVLALGECGSAGESGVVCGNPSAQRNLDCEDENRDDSPPAEIGDFGGGLRGRGGRRGAGGGNDEGDEKENGHSAEEVGDDDGGVEFLRDGKRAEDGLGGDEQGEGEDGGAVFFAPAKGDDEGAENDDSEDCGGVSVDDFNPRFFGIQGRVGVADLGGLLVGDADQLAVAGGPVGASESGVGQARKRPQHDDDKSQRQRRDENFAGGHFSNSAKADSSRICAPCSFAASSLLPEFSPATR